MITYIIKESDYLTYQLFAASKSKSVNRRRKIGWFLVPTIYIVFGVLSFILGNQKNIAIVFGGLAFFWLMIFPFYSRWVYKQKYRKYIKQNHKEMFDRPVTLSIRDNKIHITDDKNESFISYSEIMMIAEIDTHLFIRLKTGSSIIIPKEHISDFVMLAKLIQQISKSTGLKLHKDLKWKWK